MSADLIVYARLGDVAGVTGLVGTRIGPAPLEMGTVLPAITYQLISRVAQTTHDSGLGLFASRVQVDCWDRTLLGVQAVSTAVVTGLSGWRGTVAGVRVDAILHINETTMVEPTTELYRRMLEFTVWSET